MAFPASPAVGQQATENGRHYQWDGYAWGLVANVAAHATQHAANGSDPLTLVSSQISDFATAAAAAAPATTNASLLTSGTLADARLSGNVVLTTDSRLVSNGNKGDVTVSGLSWTINAGAVTEADLANAVRNSMFHPFLLMGG